MSSVVIFLITSTLAILLWVLGLLPDLSLLVTLLFSATLSAEWHRSSERKQQRLSNYLFIFIGASTAVLCIELTLRGSHHFFHLFPSQALLQVRHQKNISIFHYQKDKSFQGEILGDLSYLSGKTDIGTPRTVSFRSDSFGYRNSRANCSKPYIIALGDSFVFGTGESQENIWSQKLSKLLNKPVCNLGIAGATPIQELFTYALEKNRLEHQGRTYLILMLFSGNDLGVDHSLLPLPQKIRPQSKALTLLTSLRNSQQSCALYQFISQKFHLLSPPYKDHILTTTYRGKTILYWDPESPNSLQSEQALKNQQNWKMLEQIIRKLEEELLAKQELILTVAPTKAEVYWKIFKSNNSLQRPLFHLYSQQLAKSQNIRFIDILTPLREKANKLLEESGEWAYWTDDVHWNSIGHEIVAETLFHELETEVSQSPPLETISKIAS